MNFNSTRDHSLSSIESIPLDDAELCMLCQQPNIESVEELVERVGQKRIRESVIAGGQLLWPAIDVAERATRSVTMPPYDEATVDNGFIRLANRALSIRPVVEETLRRWSHSSGHLLNNAEFNELWRDQGAECGEENDVYFDKGRWIKRNALALHSSLLEFLHRVVLHNCFFPRAPLSLEVALFHVLERGNFHGVWFIAARSGSGHRQVQ